MKETLRDGQFTVEQLPADGREQEFRHGIFRLEKFHAGEATPYEVIEKENAYVNAGGALLLDLLIGAGGTAYNNANSHLGAGDSATAVAAGQTDLQAATNKSRKAMDATYPSRSGQVVTFRATFGTSEANYAWNEVAIFNASSGGTMLARTVSSFGTKTSAASWVLSYTLTVP